MPLIQRKLTSKKNILSIVYLRVLKMLHGLFFYVARFATVRGD